MVAALSEVGEILSWNQSSCYDLPTGYVQSRLEIFCRPLLSVVSRLTTTATVRSHVGWVTGRHLKWQTFAFFLWRKIQNRVSPAGSLVFKLILKRCWWFFSILWAWLNVSLADMTGGKMCDGAVISRVVTFFAFSFVTPSAILLLFF